MSNINIVLYLKLAELIKINFVSPSTQQNDVENTQTVIHVILAVKVKFKYETLAKLLG